MKFKQSEVTDGIFEILRKAFVARGYLPDFSDSDTYHAAMQTIIDSGKQIIEVFNVGTYKSKGEDTNNNVIINRSVPIPAKIGTGKQIDFVNNNNGTFTKMQTPENRYDIMYMITYNTVSEKYAEIIEQTLFETLGSRKFVRAVNPDGTIITATLNDQSIENIAGFWLLQRGFVDTSGIDFIEKQWRYEAINIDLIGWTNAGIVAELTEFELSIGGITTTPVTTTPTNTADLGEDLGLFNLDIEITD